MCETDYLNFKILDIIHCHRGQIKIATQNKSCSVLSCRLQGNAFFCSGTRNYTVRTGDMIYIPAGASYTQITDGEEIIALHLEILGRTPASIQHTLPDDPQAVCECFRQMDALWRRKAPGYPYACTALLYGLIAKTGAISTETAPAAHSLLAPAIAYFNAQFSDAGLSIAEGCRRCHISRVYLNRLFRQQLHTTPVQYIRSLRIQKARMLLRSGGYTHDEIAALCGFNDTKYFYTVFKAVTGTTAGKYQKTVIS